MSTIHLENVDRVNVDCIQFDKIYYPGLQKYAREMNISFKNGDVLRIILTSKNADSLEIMDMQNMPR